MSTIRLKKRGLEDLLAEHPEELKLQRSQAKTLPGKQDSYNQGILTIANLATIFPDLEHSVGVCLP